MLQETAIHAVEEIGRHSGTAAPDLHIFLGPGGMRSVVGGIGAAVALLLSGVAQRALTIGGVSGGIIPAAILAAILAARVKRKEILRLAIQTDVQKSSVQKGRIGLILDFFRLYRYESTLPKRGSYSSDKLAELMDELIPEWPESFWFPACSAGGTVVFDVNGAHRYAGDEKVRLADAPPKVGLAVCASIAIPGIINLVPYQEDHLFDGCLGAEGYFPIKPPEEALQRSRSKNRRFRCRR